MSVKLEQHAAQKSAAVKGWDLLSIGLGILGTGLIGTSLSQPGNRANGVRLLGGSLLFVASVSIERLREQDLESLSRAIDYRKQIKSEGIKREVMRVQALRDVKDDMAVFKAAPREHWPELAARLGINPPAPQPQYDAQPEPTVAMPSMATAAAYEPDPCVGGYDPEAATQNLDAPDLDSRWGFIPASQVPQWFAEQKAAGESLGWLEKLWAGMPGLGIRIEDGRAGILDGGDG